MSEKSEQARDFIYAVHYEPEQAQCDCGSHKLYALTATEHWLCLDCGKQWAD
jgi:hypothetical protein